ncbi:MAG: CPBP family intramembrane metalloprotease [Planctomycetes bacterium]|nr:CPBP family intramembrane metalloprotease [Planctomycetota bacterium]
MEPPPSDELSDPDADAVPLSAQDPEESPTRGPAFLQRPGPAVGVGFGGCLVYLVLAQLVPGILIAIYLIATGALKGGGSLELEIMKLLPVLMTAGVLASIGIVVLSRKIGWLDEGPVGSPELWKRIAWVAGIAALCPLVSMLINYLQVNVLNIEFQEQEILVAAAKTGGIGFWFAIVIGAPVGEELFFRRWFYGITRKPAGPWIAFLVSGLTFALIHFNLSGMVAYVWIAACCTLAYERSGSIWGAIAVHMFNNAIAVATLMWSGT